MLVPEIGGFGKPAAKRGGRLVRNPHETVQLLAGFGFPGPINPIVRLRQLMKSGVHAPADVVEPLQHHLEILPPDRQLFDQTNCLQPTQQESPAGLMPAFGRQPLRHGRRKIAPVLLHQDAQRLHVRPQRGGKAALPSVVGERTFADRLKAHPAAQHLLQHPDGCLEHVVGA